MHRACVRELETMKAPTRDHDEVTGLNAHTHPAVFVASNVEDALAFKDEANFVFVVLVLSIELLEERVQSWRIGPDIDLVLLDITLRRLEPVDGGLIRVETQGFIVDAVASKLLCVDGGLIVDPMRLHCDSSYNAFDASNPSCFIRTDASKR